MKKNMLLFAIILLSSISSFAQLKFGSDFYSRYVWRGVDFGDSPSFQPTLYYTTGAFTIGAWGAYSFPGNVVNYSENDLFASYAFSTEKSGTFTLLFTDYYFPSAGIKFSDFEKNGGAHTMEAGLSYSGPEKFPVSLAVFANVHNDVDNSSYIQIAYPFTVSDATLTLSAGFTPSKSVYYGTTKGALINLGASAAKSIPITDKFSVPVTVSYISNPNLDKTYLTFGMSFVF
ncbi:MAG: hypothetical protein Q8S01_14335 [Ignavibacteria bacterium]|nr:hypothetical protein [Ignavibacteria bacterium]